MLAKAAYLFECFNMGSTPRVRVNILLHEKLREKLPETR